jgi:hypothetical protein
MARAEIRIIDGQSEEKIEPNISSWEQEQLLRKYGYSTTTQPTNHSVTKSDPNGEMSYEELCRIEDQRIERERQERQRKMYGPKPTSFDGNYDSNTSYSGDPDSGFSFRVDIVSDMKIPKG